MFSDYETAMVPIGDITWTKRHRAYNPKKAKELAESIERVGLINPITVLKVWEGYRLIAGLHRLEACKMLGRSDIPTHPMEADELEAELVELDENLMHSGMTVLEQGEQLHRRNELLLALEQRATVGRPSLNTAPGAVFREPLTTQQFAEEVGISTRGLRGRVQIARDIPDDVKNIIRDTPLADSRDGLLELSRLKNDSEQQRRVAEVIAEEYAENGHAPSVAMAQSILSAAQGPTLGEQGKLELRTRFEEQRGPTILLGLLHEINVASRRDADYLLRHATAEQRQRILSELPRCIDWLESIYRSAQNGLGRKLEVVS